MGSKSLTLKAEERRVEKIVEGRRVTKGKLSIKLKHLTFVFDCEKPEKLFNIKDKT